ncbi:MAG: nucleoside triphosphate pyrophosphatase [Rubrivivax sp.]|nr:nucleoside triphosphate pyrophosphatase [Rubrivivax sp.]
MLPYTFVYLASQSPRRVQLLDQLGVAHRALLPDRSENAEGLEGERRGELPLDYVRRVTLLKLGAARARLARRQLPVAPILCADTTVAVGRRILGKPRDPAHAAEMLRSLSGRTHRVMTSVAVSAGTQHFLDTSISRVRFADLSETTIRRYVDSGEPQGKAGAYAIQGRIAAWIEHIEGSYTGIMGLPLHETTTLLSRARVRLEL